MIMKNKKRKKIRIKIIKRREFILKFIYYLSLPSIVIPLTIMAIVDGDGDGEVV